MKRITLQLSEMVRFFRQTVPDWRRHLGIAFLAGLSGVFFNLLFAWMIKGTCTAVVTGNSSLLRDFIVFFLLVLAGVFLYNCILWNIYGRSVAGMTGNLRRILFSRLCSLRLSDLECRHSGEIMSIMTNDLDAAQGAYANMRFHASMVLFSIIPSCLALKTSPPLGLFIIFLGLSQLLANLFLIKPLEGNSMKIRNKMEIINIAFSDMMKNNMTIRLYCSEEFYLKTTKEMNISLYQAKLKLNAINMAIDGINLFFGLLGYILILFTGSMLIGAGTLFLPDLLFIVQLRLMMIQGILAFGSFAVQAQPAMAGIRKILDFIGSDAEKS